ncbi:MAG: hypothetical protein ACXVCH_17520, partial [Bdellovibrionota bacterium]
MAAVTEQTSQTPLPIIANVSRVVTKVVDRICGDRVDYPLLVAAACVEALKRYGIESRVMYGQVAWIEVLSDQSVTWAGCWGEHFHFWVATQFGEVVDLNASVAHRKRAHQSPALEALHSPPMLWAAEVPAFYRFQPEGVAELELTDPKDIQRYETVLREIAEKCGPEHAPLSAAENVLEFANEPILCPGRRLLDDSQRTFRHF